jgi:hypothetical protein
MNISFYPTLNKALDSLGKGEALYTNSWFILNPIRIWYKKHTRWYKKRSGEYEQTQYVPIVIEEEKLSISDKLRLEGKKKQDRDGPTQERGLYAVKEGEKEKKIAEDVKDLYSYYCFRKEEIEELIEDLISSSEKNKGLFKEPLRKAIDLGLGEVKDKIKDKDLILVGSMPSRFFEEAKELGVLDHLAEHLRNPILMALEEEGWKKDFSRAFEEFWETNFLDIARRVEDIIRERIRYVNETEKRRHRLYRDEETYFWHKVIEVADNELGLGKGRITGDVWEKGRILGLEFGGIRKLEDHVYEAKKKLEKMGRNYAEEVFPEALGHIRILLPATPKPENSEVVIVPYGIKDKNKSGDKEIKFLTLVKLKVKNKEVMWNKVRTYETERHFSILVRPQHSMKIISKEEIPEELNRGKGKILIKPLYSEYVNVLNMYALEKRGMETELKSTKKQALLRAVKYIAETEGLAKSLVIEVESLSPSSILIKDYDDTKERKSISESIKIETFLRESVSPSIEGEKEGIGCLGGDKVDKIIKEELEQLAAEMEEYAKEETRKEEKTALESASLVAKRASEVLERGNISHSKCYKNQYLGEYYSYEIYPKPVKGYEPIIEDKGLLETFKKCCNPIAIKKYEVLFNLFGHEEREKLCFEYEGDRVKIGIEEIDKIVGDNEKKEAFYIRKFSEELVNIFVDYVNQVISKNPHSEYDLGETELSAKMPNKEDVRELNNLSLLLSGAIASSMLIPWKEKFPLIRGKKEEEMARMLGKIYKVMLLLLTGGTYEYVEKVENVEHQLKVKEISWLKRKGEKAMSMLNEKELLTGTIGAIIEVKISEGVEVFIPEYGVKKKPKMKEAGLRTYYNIEMPKESPITFYLETGKEDKVLKMETKMRTEYP